MNRRHVARLASTVALGALCALCGSAHAADRYAVLALIGDDLSIVTYQTSTGSHLDTNTVQHLANDDDRFDRVAVQNAAAAVRRTVPGATTFGIKAADPAEYGVNDAMLESPGQVKALLEPLRPVLGDARYLLIVSKSHGDAYLRTANGSIGSGKLNGLGFYLDYRKRTSNGAGERGRGFVAPYAYVTVTLVDVGTGAVVRSDSSNEGRMVSITRSPDATDPWEALTADQKVAMLGNLIRRAMERVVPQVVAPG